MNVIENTLVKLARSKHDKSPVAVIDFLIHPEYAPTVEINHIHYFAAMDAQLIDSGQRIVGVSSSALTYDVTKSHCRLVICDNLTYLPALVEVQDGISRRYATEHNVKLGDPDGIIPPKWVRLDSLAFAVASAGYEKFEERATTL